MMPLCDFEQCKQSGETVYVHYGCTAEEFTVNQIQEIKNFPPFAKPMGGFWASPVQAPFGWVDFCRKVDYAPSFGMQKKFCFSLSPEAQIFRVTAREDFELLPKMETATDSPVGKISMIDFEECVRCGIDAIEYCYSVHSDEMLSDEMDRNMPGWDCDSILIMNPQVIQPFFELSE